MWRNLTFFCKTDVEKNHILHICHVEKFDISLHLSCGLCGDKEAQGREAQPTFLLLSLIHHLLIYRIDNVYDLWCFNAYYAVLLQNLFILRFTLFCRKIRFVAIYALLRGEKFSQKLCLWRKKDKYHVCVFPITVKQLTGHDMGIIMQRR